MLKMQRGRQRSLRSRSGRKTRRRQQKENSVRPQGKLHEQQQLLRWVMPAAWQVHQNQGGKEVQNQSGRARRRRHSSRLVREREPPNVQPRWPIPVCLAAFELLLCTQGLMALHSWHQATARPRLKPRLRSARPTLHLEGEGAVAIAVMIGQHLRLMIHQHHLEAQRCQGHGHGHPLRLTRTR